MIYNLELSIRAPEATSICRDLIFNRVYLLMISMKIWIKFYFGKSSKNKTLGIWSDNSQTNESYIFKRCKAS